MIIAKLKSRQTVTKNRMQCCGPCFKMVVLNEAVNYFFYVCVVKFKTREWRRVQNSNSKTETKSIKSNFPNTFKVYVFVKEIWGTWTCWILQWFQYIFSGIPFVDFNLPSTKTTNSNFKILCISIHFRIYEFHMHMKAMKSYTNKTVLFHSTCTLYSLLKSPKGEGYSRRYVRLSFRPSVCRSVRPVTCPAKNFNYCWHLNKTWYIYRWQ